MNNITQNTKITTTDINALISECNGKLNLSGGTLNGALTVPTPFTIKAQDTSNEGGELCLKNPSSTYPVESHIDNYRNTTRIIAVDTAQSKVIDTVIFSHSNHTLSLNGYNVLTTASGKAIDSAKADYATTYLDSLGQKTSITSSGTTGNSTSDEILYRGLSVFGCYNTSGCPSNYGNIVQVKDARSQPGGGQLFLGWSGTDSTTEKCYYRSHRDTTGGGWGPWREIYMANTLSELAFANGTKLWIA